MYLISFKVFQVFCILKTQSAHLVHRFEGINVDCGISTITLYTFYPMVIDILLVASFQKLY